jgi:hypothetical protein
MSYGIINNGLKSISAPLGSFLFKSSIPKSFVKLLFMRSFEVNRVMNQ